MFVKYHRFNHKDMVCIVGYITGPRVKQILLNSQVSLELLYNSVT